MKAIVCDKCGKVILLEENRYEYSTNSGVYHLIGGAKIGRELDLCESCAEELMAAVREVAADG